MNTLFKLLGLLVLQSACVIGFRNAEQSIDDSLRRVYVPPATDSSSMGGASSRISYAVRRALSLNTNIQLVPIDEARLAIDVKIREQMRIPSGSVSDCTIRGARDEASKAEIGSKSYLCRDLGIGQATMAAENETLGVYAIADFIDLETGKTIKSLAYRVAVTHPLVSDNENERLSMMKRPDLHGLRYLERHDNALSDLGAIIAQDIVIALGSTNLQAVATPEPEILQPTPLPATLSPSLLDMSPPPDSQDKTNSLMPPAP